MSKGSAKQREKTKTITVNNNNNSNNNNGHNIKWVDGIEAKHCCHVSGI